VFPVGLDGSEHEHRIISQDRGTAEMRIEDQIDELIKAGWGVVDSDFDPIALKNWRVKAFECLTTMFGPDHAYTKYFEHFVKQGDRNNVLAAGGVLSAAKEHIKGNRIWAV